MCIIHSHYTHPLPFLIPLSPCQSISSHGFSNLHFFFIGFFFVIIEFNLVLPSEYGYGAKHWGMRDSTVVISLKTIPPLFQASTDSCAFSQEEPGHCVISSNRPELSAQLFASAMQGITGCKSPWRGVHVIPSTW